MKHNNIYAEVQKVLKDFEILENNNLNIILLII